MRKKKKEYLNKDKLYLVIILGTISIVTSLLIGASALYVVGLWKLIIQRIN